MLFRSISITDCILIFWDFMGKLFSICFFNIGNLWDFYNFAFQTDKVHTPGQLLNEMVALDNKLNHQIKKMIDLRSAAMTNLAGTVMPAGLGISTASTGSVTPDIWPVSGVVSSHFGFRISPGGIGSTYHEGLDIASSYGNPVHATANGRITQAGWVNGYGYLVEIDHGNGIKTVSYTHLHSGTGEQLWYRDYGGLFHCREN